jgi:hypothetical protein
LPCACKFYTHATRTPGTWIALRLQVLHTHAAVSRTRSYSIVRPTVAGVPCFRGPCVPEGNGPGRKGPRKHATQNAAFAHNML